MQQFVSFLCIGFLRKPLACFCPRMDCQCSLCVLLVQYLIPPPSNLCRYTKCRPRSFKWMWGASLANWTAVWFQSILMHPGIRISVILLYSAIFTRGLGSCSVVNSFVSCVVVANKGFIYSRRTAFSDGKTDWNLLQFLLVHHWEHWIVGILIFCLLSCH